MSRPASSHARRSSKPIGIDVFCGAGGMSLGFEQAGFRVVAAIDVSKINIDVHAKNFPHAKGICADIRTVTGRMVRERAGLGRRRVDVVFGGPPCQGFSVGGKQRTKDPRNELLMEFARLVIELRPRYFVMENVGGLLNTRYAPLLARFRATVSAAGYKLVEPLARLDAADFGIPQRRRRVFVLGYGKGERALGYPESSEKRITVAAAIGDLKDLDAEQVKGDRYSGKLGRPSAYARELRGRRNARRFKGPVGITGFAETAHSAEVVARFRRVKQGDVEPISRFIRLKWHGVAPTLRAGTGRENGRFMAPRPIHPDLPRCIYVREAARLHSFPDWFQFHHTKWNGFMQVGNAVPPRFARAIAKKVKDSLSTL